MLSAASFNDTHFWGLFYFIRCTVSLLPQSWFCISSFHAKPYKSSWHISSHNVCMKTSPSFFVNAATAINSRISLSNWNEIENEWNQADLLETFKRAVLCWTGAEHKFQKQICCPSINRQKDISLACRSSVRNVGVHFDQDLSFKISLGMNLQWFGLIYPLKLLNHFPDIRVCAPSIQCVHWHDSATRCQMCMFYAQK